MNELQQVLLVFAVVVIAGLYFLSRSRSTGSKKKAKSTAENKSTYTDKLNSNRSNAPDSETGEQTESQQQASKALNDLGNAHIPVSQLTRDRFTKIDDVKETEQQTEFNHSQGSLSFGEDFDLPETTSSLKPEGSHEMPSQQAANAEQDMPIAAPATTDIQDKKSGEIESDITILGTNESGGKHHRLVVEDPGMNSEDYRYAAPEHEKPTFGVPEEELGKSPGVTSGEKQEYEVFVILVMSPAQEFSMPLLNHALLGVGLVYSDQGIYVKQDNMGSEIIKVANLLEPGFFPKEDHENYATPGVAMILELPSTVRAPAAMHDLIMMARKVSQRLEGRLYNMERHLMKESDLQSMRDAAVDYESEPL